MKEKRREGSGKPVPRNLKSFSVREDCSDLWQQHRLTPSQMILDARYSMMCLVWREAAGCKLCDLRDHPGMILYLISLLQRNWCDTLLYSVSDFIFVYSGSSRCPKHYINPAWNPSGLFAVVCQHQKHLLSHCAYLLYCMYGSQNFTNPRLELPENFGHYTSLI